MTFTILGPPRTKKNSQRIVRTGTRRRVLPSKAHEEWAESAIGQLAVQIRQGGYAADFTTGALLPAALAPNVNLCALVYRDRVTGDLLNYLAAVSDALEHAGVVENDRQFTCLDGSRLLLDKERPRVEITLTEAARPTVSEIPC